MNRPVVRQIDRSYIYGTKLKVNDINRDFFTGLRIYVPHKELFIKFYCRCIYYRPHFQEFYLDPGMHYFCLCHGHNEADDLYCELRSENQIINLQCTRKPAEKYFIIYERGCSDKNDEISPPSLLHLGKSSLYQHGWEQIANENTYVPKSIAYTIPREKNCIILNCPAEVRGGECTETCPDIGRICYNQQMREDRHALRDNFTRLWDSLTDDVKKLRF
jgi:hypothetical protein